MPHTVGNTATQDAAASADVVATFALPAEATTDDASYGVCVLSDPSTPNVGIAVVANVSAADNATRIRTVSAWIGLCGDSTGWSHGYGRRTHGQFPIFPGETQLDFRVLCDRSIVEAFLMGGRGVFSQGTNDAFPGSGNRTWSPGGGSNSNLSLSKAYPTAVQAVAGGTETTIASVQVYSMGCGWTEQPWCATPPCRGMKPPTPSPTPTPPPTPLPPVQKLYDCVIDHSG
eukprot:COSAG06_NODE_6257_length_3011_cov_2.619849_1_plen_229_part_10